MLVKKNIMLETNYTFSTIPGAAKGKPPAAPVFRHGGFFSCATAPGQAEVMALSKMALKASASRTARSASILRLILMSLLPMALMNCE